MRLGVKRTGAPNEHAFNAGACIAIAKRDIFGAGFLLIPREAVEEALERTIPEFAKVFARSQMVLEIAVVHAQVTDDLMRVIDCRAVHLGWRI
jgi:hypothetical protein